MPTSFRNEAFLISFEKQTARLARTWQYDFVNGKYDPVSSTSTHTNHDGPFATTAQVAIVLP